VKGVALGESSSTAGWARLFQRRGGVTVITLLFEEQARYSTSCPKVPSISRKKALGRKVEAGGGRKKVANDSHRRRRRQLGKETGALRRSIQGVAGKNSKRGFGPNFEGRRKGKKISLLSPCFFAVDCCRSRWGVQRGRELGAR